MVDFVCLTPLPKKRKEKRKRKKKGHRGEMVIGFSQRRGD
jgi:hypothetical protein